MQFFFSGRSDENDLPGFFFFFLSKNNVPVGHGFRVWAYLGGMPDVTYYYLVNR